MKDHGHQVAEATSLDFAQFSDLMVKALGITFEPASKAAADLLVAAYLDTAAVLSDEQGTAGAVADTPDGAAGTAEKKDAAAYAVSLLAPPGPRDGAPAGELAYPQQLLESLKDEAAFDALEAQINQALGRADT